jgi:putative transposase
MPRRPRCFLPGVPVHIVQRGNNRQPCFTCDADRAAYVNWLSEGAAEYGLAIHAWVLMTNHVHLLATPEREDSVSRTMQYLGRYYVRHFNFRYDRTGTLFEGRFKANLVQSSRYFLGCCRYIELNPVRAGMAENPAKYTWSSYAAHAFGKNVAIWSPHEEYLALGNHDRERQSCYRDLFITQMEKAALDEIRESIRTGFVLGDDTFRGQMAALTGQPQYLKKRGPASNT